MLTYSSDVVSIPSCALDYLILPIKKWFDFSSKSKTEQNKVVLREIIQPR